MRIPWICIAICVVTLTAFFLISPYVINPTPATYGFSISSDTSAAGTETLVDGGTGPYMLAFAGLAILLYCFTPKTKNISFEPAGFWLRLGSFVIDFFFFILALGSLIGLLMVYVEAHRTGVFHWQFTRNYSVPSDFWIGLPSILLLFAALFFYFAFALMRGRQTIGEYVFQIQTIAVSGSTIFTFKQARRTMWVSFRHLTSPIRFWRDLKSKKYSRRDEENGTIVAKVTSAPFQL